MRSLSLGLLLIQVIILMVLAATMYQYRTTDPSYEIYADRGIIRINVPVFAAADMFGVTPPDVVPPIAPFEAINFEMDCDILFYRDNVTCFSPVPDEVPTSRLHIIQVAAPNGIFTVDAVTAPDSSPECRQFSNLGSTLVNNNLCSTSSPNRAYIVPPPPPTPIQLEHTIVYMGGISTQGSRAGTALINTYPSNRPLSSPPVGLVSFGLTVLNNEIYIAGGNQPLFVSNQFMKYVPLTDVWVTLPNIPVGRLACYLTTHNDNIYIAGGDDDILDMNITDISVFSNNSWSTWGAVPSTCFNIYGFASFQSKLYIVAVCNRTLITMFRWGTQWEPLDSLSYVKYTSYLSEHLYTVVICDSLYIFYQAPNNVILKRYNGSALIDVGNFSVPSIVAASYAILDSTIYFIGGADIQGNSITRVISYDIINNIWNTSLPPLLFPLANFGAAAVILPLLPSPPPTFKCAGTGNIYVTNIGDGTVSVIDIAIRNVAFITVGTAPWGVAISPNGSFVYVANSDSSTVSVIDTSTRTVTDTITVGFNGPSGVAISPDGSFVYVTNIGDVPGTVSVINTTTGSVSPTPINVGREPTEIVVSPDSAFVYVANFGVSGAAGTVSVIDIATGAVSNTITVGIYPRGVAISPNGAFVYVANSDDDPGTVSVIDTANKAVVGDPIGVGTNPVGVAISPDGAFVYVTNQGDDTVSVITAATKIVSPTSFRVGSRPAEIVVSPDGAFVYVTNSGSDSISVIDIATGKVSFITVGSHPRGVAVCPGPPPPTLASTPAPVPPPQAH